MVESKMAADGRRPWTILLTNDDGVDAPGLGALHASVRQVIETDYPGQPYQVIVVAPDRCRSECGHSIETTQPLAVQPHREGWFRLNGTPVDCIRVAHYAMQVRPDFVFSGINAGANLGVNLMVSGTFAAAREASLLGIPAMAASHYRRPDVPRTWDHAPTWLAQTIADFLEASTGERYGAAAPLWNVNLPAIDPDANQIPPREHCQVDRCPIARSGSIDPQGHVRFDLDFHGRPREPGRDVDHCFRGRITISRLDAHLQP